MYKVIKLSSVGKMPKQMKTIPAFPGCFYSEHAHGSSTSFFISGSKVSKAFWTPWALHACNTFAYAQGKHIK